MRKLFAPLALLTALAACGQKADLEPLPGESLPVAPYGVGARPSPEDLLELDPVRGRDRHQIGAGMAAW